jgi:hypothetical protein
MVRRGSDQVQQVLVKWNNLSAELATWEDYEALRQEYPRATAWGQAVLKEGGMSATRLMPSLEEMTKDGPSH